MRRVNFQPVLKLGVGATILCGLVVVVHHVQIGRTARLLRARAEILAAAGRDGEALDLVGKYLALRPADASALANRAWLLDRTAADQADRARALAAFEKVIRGQPGRADARRRLAVLLAEQGRYNNARVHLRILIDAAPGDATVEELMGRCEEFRGDAAEAARWYRLALRHDPQRRGAALSLAALGRGPLHSPEAADRVLDDLIAADPKAFDVWLARARHRRDHGLAGADADLAKAATLAPQDPGVALEAARSARLRGEFDQARAVLDRAAPRHPFDARFFQERADLELKIGRPDEAVAVLRRGLTTLPGAAGLRWSLASLAAERGDGDELARLIDRFRADPAGYPSPAIDYLNAWLASLRGRPAEAAHILERAEPGLFLWPSIRSRADELLARCYGRLGDTVRRADADRRALLVDPQRCGARLDLATLLWSQGRIKEANSLLRDPAFIPPSPAPAALLRLSAEIALAGRHSDEIEPAFRALLARRDVPPADLGWARRVYAVWSARLGAPDSGREALSLLGDAVENRRARARVLAALGGRQHRREAVALLEVAAGNGLATDEIDKQADDRILLASLYEADGDWPRARRLILGLSRSEALDTPGRARLAELLLRHDEIDSAAPLIQRVANDAPDERRTVVLRARLMSARGEGRAAADLLIQRAEAHPGESSSIAALLERLGEVGPAEALHREAAEVVGRPEASLALAEFLARRGNAEEAFSLCERAWAHCRSDAVARASATVFAATAASSRSSDGAVGRLETAAVAEGATLAVVVSLASVRENQGRFDEAEALYRRALRRAGDDPAALNNLAVLVALRGRNSREAVDLADRAIKRAGPVPELLDTRGLARLLAGDAAAAVVDLAEAADAAPAAAIYFHLAQAYLHVGDRDAAASALRRASALGLADRALHPLERVALPRLVADIARP